MGAGWVRAALGVAVVVVATSGCAGEPAAIPTIGSPQPSASASASVSDRGAALAQAWHLTGVALPADWPDIPLPKGTEVTTAYAIGTQPRRTWTATFAADRGTALDLATPVVKALRKRGYVPIAQYVGAAQTNTGLYSFAAPSFAVYVVLGEDDGRPNLVITVRGSSSDDDPDATGPAIPRGGASSAGPSADASSASPSTDASPGQGDASGSAQPSDRSSTATP